MKFELNLNILPRILHKDNAKEYFSICFTNFMEFHGIQIEKKGINVMKVENI